jgi:hypothetical protein
VAGALVFAVSGYSDVNLRAVRWGEVSIPGSFCATVPNVVRLHHGSAFTKTQREGPPLIVEVDSGPWPVVYGYLGRNRRDPAAALTVNCNNGGGTADGVLAYADVIFGGAGKSLRVIGAITPKVQKADELPTLLKLQIRAGEVIVHESWYGGSDGTCCPTGRATTVWKYEHGHLRAGKSVITRRSRVLTQRPRR